MDFKPKAKVSSDDFWYDLFDGGYIKPEKILNKGADLDRVVAAINTLKEFKEDMEELEILDFN